MITVFRNDSGKFFSFLNSQIQHFITFSATPISLLLVIFVYKNKNAFAESLFVLEWYGIVEFYHFLRKIVEVCVHEINYFEFCIIQSSKFFQRFILYSIEKSSE